MFEYHKINSIFNRDPSTKHKSLIYGQFSEPAFEYLARAIWIGTEKIDGINIRIDWDGSQVRFGGRTDKAQIPTHLLNYLQEKFTPEFLSVNLQGPITLYGEGFGAKIQKGGENYRATAGFILFDAYAGPWLERASVIEIAQFLGIPHTTVVYVGSLWGAVDIVRAGFKSSVSVNQLHPAEGLVLRPEVELLDRQGRRIITKIKTKDFQW